MSTQENTSVKQIYGGGAISKKFRRWSLFFAILLSGGMLLFPRPLLLALLLLLIFLTSRGKGLLLKSSVAVWVLLFVIFVASILRPGPFDWGSLVIRYANFIVAALLLNIYIQSERDAIQSDLMKILPWMGWQAIVTFALANIVPFVFMKVSFDNFQFSTVFLLFNFHELIEGYSGLKRPNGFFYEPGVFQLYLNIYLYLALFVARNRWHVALSTAAVFCTLSTTGLLIGATLWFASFAKKSIFTNGGGVNAAAILILISVAPILSVITYQNIQEKLYGEMQGSAMAREYDLYTGLNILKEHPLLGIGFDHDRYLELSPLAAYSETLLSEESVANRSTSNGIVHLFYTLGIPLGLMFCICAYKQQLFPHKKIFSVLILASLLGESIVYTPFILVIIFSGLCNFPGKRKGIGRSL